MSTTIFESRRIFTSRFRREAKKKRTYEKMHLRWFRSKNTMHGTVHVPCAINNIHLFQVIFGECLSTIVEIAGILFESAGSPRR